jgi:phosphoribosylglycinamide formyltransferase-1
VRWFAEDKLTLDGGRVRLAAAQADGAALLVPELL